jgi:hypothetical protein
MRKEGTDLFRSILHKILEGDPVIYPDLAFLDGSFAPLYKLLYFQLFASFSGVKGRMRD